MAGYNLTREVEDLLERIEPLPPSFTVHLHPDYWTLNSGSKFLYNNQIAVSGMSHSEALLYSRSFAVVVG